MAFLPRHQTNPDSNNLSLEERCPFFQEVPKVGVGH